MWYKCLAYGTAFVCATGTTAKLTYDFTVPKGGKLVQAKLNNGTTQKVDVWLPEFLAEEVPQGSTLQLTLGERKDESTGKQCLEVQYKGVSGNEGGLVLQGSLVSKTDMRDMPICNGQEVWTVAVKDKEETKKIRCQYGYGLTQDTLQGDRKLLKCRDRKNQEEEEIRLGEVTCKKVQHKNLFICESPKGVSLKHVAIAGSSSRQDPAVEVTIPAS
ncbi:hypothetical protein MHLP_04125 [Candidatus Mycoplasma haematolamae str. Purdue]|uniref:Uncharacterized protein n=1 Tax=Mycoplasma haematolamae (strain Purdue) TaxID=1212765 RepID=I7BAQ5_MYCHA|nr:hypothetical protein [Candidatus Mycoplasma haematolamae]AFO52405.1 hypothetical protein MHLP_04125 [Candidatus Mycoplasma haematolamae str. Purdue]